MKKLTGILCIMTGLLACVQMNSKGRYIGIVDDNLNKISNEVTAGIQQALISAGHDVSVVGYGDLEQMTRFDVLIVPDGRYFPVAAAGNLHDFLSAGKDFISLGGDPFSYPLYYVDGKFFPFGELCRYLYSEKAAVIADPSDMAVQSWNISGSETSEAMSVRENDQDVFRFMFRDVEDVCSFDVTVSEMDLDGMNGLVFYAKSDRVTPQVMIRLMFSDGIVCEGVADIDTEWGPVCISLADMKVVGGNTPLPESLAGLSGVSLSMREFRNRFHDHDLLTTAIKAVSLPEEYGTEIEKGDFVLCEDRDIYRYGTGTQILSADTDIVGNFNSSGVYSGISALGFPVYGQSVFIPLLEVKDPYDRRCGWAAGSVFCMEGDKSGASWTIFGIENHDWYTTPAFLDYFISFVESLEEYVPQDKGNLPVTTCEIDPMQRVGIKDGHFVKEDGSRLFIIGENLGSILYDRSVGQYDEYSLDRLFRQLSKAGINALRILNLNNFVNTGGLEKLADAAERWGVYLLAGASPGKGEMTCRAVENYMKKLSHSLNDEPVLLGYDLRNEPYIHEIRRYKDKNGVALSEKYPYSQASMKKFVSSIPVPGSYGSAVFQGYDDIIPRPEDRGMAQAYDAVNNTFCEWIDWHKTALSEAGDTHPVTVGYNLWYAACPLGRQLDFIAQHAYVFPSELSAVEAEITVMDRLHSIYPDKPVTMGEFGYTAGYVIDGRPLSSQASALGEMLHLLYSWSQGYDGVFDWQVYDFTPVDYARIAVWNRDRYEYKQKYEKYHGIYAYDGTDEGILKPFGMLTGFFRKAVDAGMSRGKLEYFKADTQIGTGFVYTSDNAMFVGNTEYEGDSFSFVAPEERVVCMFKTDGKMYFMSTGDIDLTISAAGIRNSEVNGKYAGITRSGDAIVVSLLAGEVISVTGQKNTMP